MESTTLVDHIAAEIVPTLDRPAAERLDRRIRLLVGTINDNIAKLHELVQEAKTGAVHVALGFPSWTAYLADAFTIDVRLERGARAELVGYLNGEGMSQRAIADVVGVDRKTVRKDIAEQVGEKGPPDNLAPVIGLDGKRYQPKPASPNASQPRRKPITDAFDTAVCDLGKVTQRLARLADDDRFDRSRSAIASQRLGDLQRAGQLIDEVTDKVEDVVVDQQVAAALDAWQPDSSTDELLAHIDVIEDVTQYATTLMAVFKQTFAPHRLSQLHAADRRALLLAMKETVKEIEKLEKQEVMSDA